MCSTFTFQEIKIYLLPDLISNSSYMFFILTLDNNYILTYISGKWINFVVTE